ncbi:tyrosine--tRNA ligase [Chlamydiota bacterium]
MSYLKMMNRTPKEQVKIITNGIADLILEEDLLLKLESSCKEKRPLRVKYGADPSAPDIHLGHTVPLKKLRQFQDLGHIVVFIIGDFTALIGDPSGVSKTRKKLTKQEVMLNARTYQEQVFKILDKKKTEVLYNSSWLSQMTFEDVLTLTSKYTVARMMERDDFSNRYKQGKQISILEFLYPLMQGYDSVAVRADVELGGTDQTFNLLVARLIQKEYGIPQQVIVTVPILEGIDGVNKMSKSLGNYIGVTENPKEIFGKIMSINDELMLRYYELVLCYQSDKINKLTNDIKQGILHPMDAKKTLACSIIRELYSDTVAKQSEQEFIKIFSQKNIPTEIEEFEWTVHLPKKEWIVRLLEKVRLVASKNEARRMILQGGVSINGEKIEDSEKEIAIEDGMIVRVGKRKFKKIIIKNT